MATLAEVTGSRKVFGLIPFGDVVTPVEKFPKFRDVQVSHKMKSTSVGVEKYELHRVRVEALDNYRVFVHPCTAPNCAEPERKPNIVLTGEINIDRAAGKIFRWNP